MITTKNGYRLTKNGNPIKSIESNALVTESFKANPIKENGTYYFFNRKQGNNFIYLP